MKLNDSFCYNYDYDWSIKEHSGAKLGGPAPASWDHRKYIPKPNKLYFGALGKGTSPRINSNPNTLYFGATHQTDITENMF